MEFLYVGVLVLGFLVVVWTERARSSRLYEAQRRNEEQVRGWAERQFKFMLDAQAKQSKVLTETVDTIVSHQQTAINEAQHRANDVATAIFTAEREQYLNDLRGQAENGSRLYLDDDLRIDDLLGDS